MQSKSSGRLSEDIPILPAPQHLTFEDGRGLRVTKSLLAAVEKALVTMKSSRPVILKLAPDALKDIRDILPGCAGQAYCLKIGKQTVSVTARGRAGLFYGLQTFKQMLDQASPGLALPRVTICDYPDLAWRGLQYDLARGMTYRHEHIKDVIRHMTALKLNMLHLYLEGRFAYPSHPELHQPGWMTPDEARDLCAFAGRHYVTLVPQVNVLGHMEQILHAPANAGVREDFSDPEMICPSNPKSLPFVVSLVKDLCDAFDTPFIHIGMDEVPKLGHCPACRARIEKDGHPGRLLADHVNAVASYVRERGRRAMIWGDMLLDKMSFPGAHAANGGVTGWGSRNYTSKALDSLDRGIIICDWQYAHFSPAEMAHLRSLGFDIMPAMDSDERGCPWGPARGIDFHIRNFFDAAKENGALGAFTCTWSLQMGEVFNNRWLDFARSAETLWTRRSYDPDEIGRRFSRIFFGLDEPLVHYLDRGIKINVLPDSMRLVPNLMRLDRPWAILEAPAGAKMPVAPPGSADALISAKEQYLVQWRKAKRAATRRRHLLEAMDIPLLVDALAMRMFHLKGGIGVIYDYAQKQANDRLAQNWCRESLITAMRGLIADVQRLRDRFETIHRSFGNDIQDVRRAENFLAHLKDLLAVIEAAPQLLPRAQWCPPALQDAAGK